MPGHANWPHSRTAAAVRNAKGLVEIEMANVGPKIARTAKTDLRVHVGPIHVDLPAMRVNDFADLSNGLFENAVGGRISDHQRGQIVPVLLGFNLEVGNADI